MSAWTAEDEVVIERLYGRYPIKTIARIVDKSARAVWDKARRMGLMKDGAA